MSFFPRFAGEMPDIFQQINQTIRSKYQLVYHPTNAKQDGTYRKLRVELVDDEGQPLRIAGREAQAAEIRHHCPRRLPRQAGSGVAAKPQCARLRCCWKAAADR